ncbi:MAG: hypothetical protein DBX47_07575 [Clostridiales bacterium]|nr:MAG: hypothetical protein DBX47_07575 [Clostridiales bacterium]
MFFNKALPVWAKECDGKLNVLLSFETTVEKNECQYTFSCAADNFYRLIINDSFIYYGPARCGKGHWRVDTFDITEKLCTGKNFIRIEVIHYGVNSFVYENQTPFLQAEILEDNVACIWTGKHFVCRQNLSKEVKVQRFSFQRPMIESYSLPFEYSNPLTQYQTEQRDFLPNRTGYPTFKEVFPTQFLSSGNFEKVSEKEAQHFLYHGINGDGFSDDEITTWHSDIVKNIKTTLSTKEDKIISEDFHAEIAENNWHLMKLDVENTGFWAVDLEADEDSLIYFSYAEVLNDDGSFDPIRGDMCSFVPLKIKKGKHSFLGIEPSTVHYIKIFCFYGKVKYSKLRIYEYKSPKTENVVLNSSDEKLNRIFYSAVSTFAQNAVDLFTDCPSRERAGWLCDSFFTARTEFELTKSSDIEHAFLENIIISPDFDLPKGMLPMCYPASSKGGGKDAQFIPNWAMWFVIELQEFLLRSGDTSFIMRAKDRVFDLLEYFEKYENSDGLLQNLCGWIFVEWSKANDWVQDINFPTNMLYYKMLVSAHSLYGDQNILDKAEKLKKQIISQSFNGMFFCDNSILNANKNILRTNNISETCQYYAFFCDVATPETFPGLYKIILSDFGPGRKCLEKHPNIVPANTFIGNYLRLDILDRYSETQKLRKETVDYFDYMAQKTGTLWENDGSYASCNHGFASYVACLIRKFTEDPTTGED